MGISQIVHTYYGWIFETTPEHMRWANDTDYQLPKGVLFFGMDSTEIVVGIELFNSGDARWGAMGGFSMFTEKEAKEKLAELLLDDDLGIFRENMQGEPKFMTFVNCS